MKLLSILIIGTGLSVPICSIAQQDMSRPNDIRIALARENEFVVKLMDVYDKSGKKIEGPVALDSFSIEKKRFIFKNANGKLQKISDKEIDKLVFSRLRQGILTGKPSSLRVNVWNGKTRNFVLKYGAVKIENGYLYLSQDEWLDQFNDADKLRAAGNEWSEKLHAYWKKTKENSPELFATDFAFKNGHAAMTRKVAAVYCRTCLKIEILRLKIDPAAETVSVRCKDVFYNKYNE